MSARSDQRTMETCIRLRAGEAAHLEVLAKGVTADPATEAEEFCRQARLESRHLPKGLTGALLDFARFGNPLGFLSVSNLPVGAVPATPSTNHRHRGEKTLLARAQAIINESFGNMVGYEAEGGGRLFQDIVPAPRAAFAQTSLSSRVELELHTEQAFSPLRPDYVSLACLRGDRAALTYVLSIQRLIQHLSAQDTDLLYQPLWMTGVDESFRLDGRQFLLGDSRGPMPILSGATDDPALRFDQDLMRGVTPQAQRLLGTVIAIYLEQRATYCLQPGDLVILDNMRAVHGRSPFAAAYDGADRFLVRSFVVNDLVASRPARDANGRTISAVHS